MRSANAINIFFLFFFITEISCRSRATSGPRALNGIEQTSVEAQKAFLDMINAQPDRPPSGTRSVFDHLVGNGPVPFPFQELVRRIYERVDLDSPVNTIFGESTKKDKLAITLIPFSRSLQRKMVNEKSPRMVLAVDFSPKVSDADFGLPLQHRLFIGFAEQANQLEVISYNDEAGRFEFQIVSNYRQGSVPKVEYARRSFCTACHQNQGPIFPRGPWDETSAPANGSGDVARLLVKSMGEGSTFHGLKIDLPSLNDESAYRIQNTAQSGDAFRDGVAFWHEICGNDLVDATFKCRASMLKHLLYPTSERGQLKREFNNTLRSLPLVVENWKRKFQQPYGFVSSFIENRDPFNQPSSEYGEIARDDLSGVVKEELKRLVLGANLPKELNPLTVRFQLISRVNRLDQLDFHEDLENYAPFSLADISYLKEQNNSVADAIDILESNARTGIRNVLTRPTLVRDIALADIRKAQGLTTIPNLWSVGEDGLPPVFVQGRIDTSKRENMDEHILPFMTHCADCHASGEYNFLASDDAAELKQSMRVWASRIVAVLNWESMPPPKKPMPPGIRSSQLPYEERRKMLDFITSLGE